MSASEPPGSRPEPKPTPPILVRGLAQLASRRGAGAAPPSLVAIGNFDGVHLGHQAVLRAAAERARERGLHAYILTFDPHPAEVLAGVKLEKLTGVERKAELMRRVSADLRLVVEPFTHELAAHTPEEFALGFLRDKLGATQVLVGENFRFGKGRAGDLRTLQQLGAKFGFDAHAEPLLRDAEAPVSSSRVRTALGRGALDQAARLLGRPHAITGVVAPGARLGRTIGFPTANLEGVVEMLPPPGVYACLVDVMGDLADPAGGEPGRLLATAVTNIGHRPTVDGSSAKLTIEAHLLRGADGQAFSGDLYGQRLRLHLAARLRPERKFPSLAALRTQIQVDVAEAEQSLASAVRAAESKARGHSSWV